MTIRLTTKRTANGQFDVFFDGQPTGWQIVNGSLGMSGTGRNMYGIVKGDFHKWIGPLNSCKKMLALTLAKEAK